jgi:DNA polymerase-3 subunit gamma/tau
MFGLQSLDAVATAVRTQNGSQMLEIVQDLERNGHSLHHFSRELSRYWRNLLVAKISGKTSPLIAASDPEQQSLLATSAHFSEEDLTRYLNLSLDLYKALQESLQPRLHLELGLIKLVQAGKLQSIEDALAGLGGTAIPGATVTQRAAAPRPEPLKMTASRLPNRP